MRIRYCRFESVHDPGTAQRTERNAEHLGTRAEVESPVGLVAVPDANCHEHAIFVAALLNPQEFTLPAGSCVAQPKIDSGRPQISVSTAAVP